MKKLVIGIMFAAAAVATLPCAAAGAAFTYQGVIKEVGGATPENKNRTVEFRIYDGPGTSAQVLWGRAYSVLLDANGLFNTSLTDAAGSEIDAVPGTGLADVLARNAGTTLYIGLTVDNSSGEISPRQALLAVPYAIHASDAAAASGEFTVEGKATLKGGLEVSGGDEPRRERQHHGQHVRLAFRLRHHPRRRHHHVERLAVGRPRRLGALRRPDIQRAHDPRLERQVHRRLQLLRFGLQSSRQDGRREVGRAHDGADAQPFAFGHDQGQRIGSPV